MSCVNYSKWDHIEISDDEDDTHPNIDTASLFKWRHEARVQRMEESKKEHQDVEKNLSDKQQKLTEIRQKLQEADKEAIPDLDQLKLELSELEKQEKEWKKKEEELKKKDKLTPLNIDTICHEGKSKTIINKLPSKPKELSEEERVNRQEEFTGKYKPEIKKFGMMRKYDDSQAYLEEHPDLTCDETANFLVMWCIDLAMEEKFDLMNHVAHQTIVMQFILELAKGLDRDPRGCVRGFFSRIKLAEKQYMEAFNDELEAFKQRVTARAKVRLEQAMKEVEEEERQKRLGPGGMDPVEVFETLPKVLQDCFESKDLELLQKVIVELPREEAEYHMKRCVDSGLWVPNAADLENIAPPPGASESDDGDETYEDVSEEPQS